MKVFESFIEIYENQQLSGNFKKLIPRSVVDIADAFYKNNKSLYIVGGAVRDFLMKKKPKDFDLATDALPEETEKILRGLRLNILEVGKQFGIVIAVDKRGEQFEIATFREDIGSGRRPDAVRFTTIETDVKRRDLTINALFYDIAKNKIVDLVGGQSDIDTGTIKTVGKPEERFEEDKLRKLRAIRFYARSGQKFDQDTEAALHNTDLAGVSPERIYEEFTKGCQKNAKKYIETLIKFDYLKFIFPNLRLTTKIINEDNYILQAAYLLQNENTSKIQTELNAAKWSSDNIADIKWLIRSSKQNTEEAYTLIRQLEQQITIPKADILKWAKYFDIKWYKLLAEFDLKTIDKAKIARETRDKSQINSTINKQILSA